MVASRLNVRPTSQRQYMTRDSQQAESVQTMHQQAEGGIFTLGQLIVKIGKVTGTYNNIYESELFSLPVFLEINLPHVVDV